MLVVFQISQHVTTINYHICIVSNYSLKPALEGWHDCVKKVMRLWKKIEDGSRSKNEPYTDIDDFYLYLYDEEDMTANQMTFNKRRRSGKIK